MPPANPNTCVLQQLSKGLGELPRAVQVHPQPRKHIGSRRAARGGWREPQVLRAHGQLLLGCGAGQHPGGLDHWQAGDCCIQILRGAGAAVCHHCRDLRLQRQLARPCRLPPAPRSLQIEEGRDMQG